MCITNGQVFESTTDCEKRSIDIFKIHLNQTGISAVCLGNAKSYKKLKFKFITEEEYEILKDLN